MNDNQYVISRGNLKKDQLSGTAVLITGAGGGIGFEAARSLLWLGADVVIAEVDRSKGLRAQALLNEEFGGNRAVFFRTDVSSEKSVRKLARFVYSKYGKLDVLFNNATITPIGAVHAVGIKSWDESYGVNLMGPVMLVSQFLPDMLKRNSGVIVFVPSSGAAPYMGAYEVFKTSQVELSSTLAGELDGTGVLTYSIGPGIVKTETAVSKIKEIAPLYHKTPEEFFKMNEHVQISAEEAGAGFAASVAMASRHNGTETSSIQALTDAGIIIETGKDSEALKIPEDERAALLRPLENIEAVFREQSEGWNKRVVFERQWVLRDFKKYAGASPEIFTEELGRLKDSIHEGMLPVMNLQDSTIGRLDTYYRHQMDLLKGYERNQDKLHENMAIMQSWLNDIDEFSKTYKRIMND